LTTAFAFSEMWLLIYFIQEIYEFYAYPDFSFKPSDISIYANLAISLGVLSLLIAIPMANYIGIAYMLFESLDPSKAT